MMEIIDPELEDVTGGQIAAEPTEPLAIYTTPELRRFRGLGSGGF